MTSLSFQNPTDDLRAEENHFPRRTRPEMGQALRQVLLADGPYGASKERRDFRDGDGFAEYFLLGGGQVERMRDRPVHCNFNFRVGLVRIGNRTGKGLLVFQSASGRDAPHPRTRERFTRVGVRRLDEGRSLPGFEPEFESDSKHAHIL